MLRHRPPPLKEELSGCGGEQLPLHNHPLARAQVDAEHAGGVINLLNNRKGEMLEMVPLGSSGRQRLVFQAPSRGLIGFRANFVNATRGSGICHRAFLRFDTCVNRRERGLSHAAFMTRSGPDRPHPCLRRVRCCSYKGHIDQTRKGVLVSMAQGKTTTFALSQAEARGELFVAPGTEVYNGMIVGECARDSELELNPTREKVLSNVRSVTADEKIYLSPPRVSSGVPRVCSVVRAGGSGGAHVHPGASLVLSGPPP